MLTTENLMKRFHVHLHVDDLSKSIAFYSRLFAAEPSRVERDYAKWMLDDPRVNFAISTVGQGRGIDHLGIQAENEDELGDLKRRALSAEQALLDEGETTCCYARSVKHWVTDPQGIAWEHYRTLEAALIYGKSRDTSASLNAPTACCGPASTAAKACC